MVGTYYRNPKSEREAVKGQQICKFKKTDRQVVGVSVPVVPLVVIPPPSPSPFPVPSPQLCLISWKHNYGPREVPQVKFDYKHT